MRGREFYRRKAGRRDANHAAIRDGLRALGHFVVDTAGVGDGVPDLLVYPRWPDMIMHPTGLWLEVKTEKGKLRAAQLAWATSAKAVGLHVATARTLDEALAAVSS